MGRTPTQQFEYYLKNRTHILQKKKEYREQNKDKIIKYKKEWNLNNKDKKSIHDKTYREKKKHLLIESGIYSPQRTRLKITKRCDNCGNEMILSESRINNDRGKYCSISCKNESKKKTDFKICEICGDSFSGRPSEIKPRKYCSEKCMGISKKTQIEKTCLNCEKAFHEKPSRIEKGKGKFCSQKCAGSFKTKTAIEKFFVRTKCDPNQRKQKSVLDTQWSKKIKLKNNGKCIVCGKKATDAHHLLFREFYPLLRFNYNNGVPMCKLCHWHAHGQKLS